MVDHGSHHEEEYYFKYNTGFTNFESRELFSVLEYLDIGDYAYLSTKDKLFIYQLRSSGVYEDANSGEVSFGYADYWKVTDSPLYPDLATDTCYGDDISDIVTSYKLVAKIDLNK